MASDTPGVVSPSLRRPTNRRGGNKGILQSNPKYQTVVLTTNNKSVADKRDDLPQERGLAPPATSSVTDSSIASSSSNNSNNNDTEAIPEMFVKTINEGFGEDADIFQDVLKVSPDAEPRQLRICYFRRGREILLEGGVAGMDGLASGKNVSELTKTRFQAISMAYEILSNPVWRAIYINQGLKPVENYPNSAYPQPPSKLAKVKWNENVEELIFDREPDEKIVPFERKKKNRSRKAKAKIFIEENAELDEHLAMLDAEAEPHFVTDFFDSLEESLDGLLKLASNRDGSSPKAGQSSKGGPSSKTDSLSSKTGSSSTGGSSSRQRTSNNEESSSIPGRERGPIERVTSHDEDSLVGMFATHILRMPPASAQKPTNSSTAIPHPVSPEATHKMVPLSNFEAKAPFRCVSPDPCREDDPLEVESITLSFTPTSSLASSKQGGSKKNDRKKKRQKDYDDDDDDNEDVFDGIEEEKPSSISMPRNNHRSMSPANFSMASMVSELSESVANQSQAPDDLFEPFVLRPDDEESKSGEQVDALNGGKLNTKSVEELFKELPDEEFFEDTWCQPSQVAKALRFGEPDPDDEEPNSEDEGESSTKDDDENEGDIPMKKKRPSSKDEGFLHFFQSFIIAIARDCESMGNNMSEIDWKNAVLGAFMVEDDEVLQLMDVVAKEMGRVPALHAEDAMESPTQLVIDAARSFS